MFPPTDSDVVISSARLSIHFKMSDERQTLIVGDKARGRGNRDCATHRLMHDFDSVVNAVTS